jgi:hypothetical protein
MQLRKSRFFLFARGSQLDNVVTSPWIYHEYTQPLSLKCLTKRNKKYWCIWTYHKLMLFHFHFLITPKHIPLQYSCPLKPSNQFRLAYVTWENNKNHLSLATDQPSSYIMWGILLLDHVIVGISFRLTHLTKLIAQLSTWHQGDMCHEVVGFSSRLIIIF